MDSLIQVLPHINASLNSLATILLVSGLILIKRGREDAHRRTMLACFGVSTLFLICYLIYHGLKGGSTPFPTTVALPIRYLYYGILLSHVVLAATVPVLAIITIRLGLKNDRIRHLCWARVTFPIWLYVSLTGVMVYVMLYHLFRG